MSELPIEDYTKKLLMLENRVGARTKYKILEPFLLGAENIVMVQNAVRRIAEFVGLQNLSFIVSVARQDDKAGGHVELEHGQSEVFIEISENVAKSSTAVLATLAHEITHKYLQEQAISVGPGPKHKYENEVFTDIATVFLGLGKLMLNGCISKTCNKNSVETLFIT